MQTEKGWFGRTGDWSSGLMTLKQAQDAVRNRLAARPCGADASGNKQTPGALSDWLGCVDCGRRVRVTYSPPRCNVCFNRAKAGQRALERRRPVMTAWSRFLLGDGDAAARR
jgi:hypothetical protein